MTSMIDVVFLLLIFFLVTTTFVKAERQLRPAIKLQDQSKTTSSQGFLEPAIIRVERVGGRDVFRIGGRDLTAYDELIQILVAFENKSDGAFVVVSDQVSFNTTAAAISACREAGFLSVSYVPADEAP